MRYLIALLVPWLAFFMMGRVFSGIICFALQLTFIGWLPATIWAFFAISDYHANQRTDKILEASRSRISDNGT
ncbi:MAG: YqaE/Pmp3 family membrane protein [Methylocella sp.]